MEIKCKVCGYTFDYVTYSGCCPKCQTQNKAFRSISASAMMGEETEMLRNRYFPPERRAAADAREVGHGQSFWRRMRNYFIVLVFCFGVAALGTALTRFAQQRERVERMQDAISREEVVKPPILELASASFTGAFQAVYGEAYTVVCTGTVPEDLVFAPSKESKWVFVSLLASVEDTDKSKLEARFTLLPGTSAKPVFMGGDSGELDLRYFTPLKLDPEAEEDAFMGQIFFKVPADCEEFVLCLHDSVNKKEQRMKLHL